jgi:DNA polymerase
VLGEALAEAGIREADVLIVNSISCQPHPVHPTVAAIRSCRGRLIEEVGAHPRSVIVALGATAIRALTDRAGFAVMRDHGQVIPSAWGAIIPTLHPARVLRVRSERPLLVADLTAARHLAEGQAS